MDPNSHDIDAWRRVHRQLTLALIQSRDNIAAELTKRRYLLEEMNRCKMQNTQKSAPGGGSSTKTKKKAAPKKVIPKKAPAVAVKVKKVASTPSAESAKSAPPKAPLSSTKIKPQKTDGVAKKGVMTSSKLPSATVVATKVKPQKTDGTVNKAMVASISRPPTTQTSTATGKGANNNKGASPQKKAEQPTQVGDNDNGSDALLQPSQQFAEIAQQQINPMFFAQQYGLYGNLGLGLATPQQMSLAVQMMQQMNQNLGMEAEDDSDEEETTLL